MKNTILGFIVCLFLGNTGWAQQTVWVAAAPTYVVVQPVPAPVVFVQKEYYPVYVLPQYGWVPRWRRWWEPYPVVYYINHY